MEAGTGPLLWVLAEEESEGPQSVAKALVHTRGEINVYKPGSYSVPTLYRWNSQQETVREHNNI